MSLFDKKIMGKLSLSLYMVNIEIKYFSITSSKMAGLIMINMCKYIKYRLLQFLLKLLQFTFNGV